MCWEDVQIGRATKSVLTIVDVPQNVITRIVSPSADRRVLAIWPCTNAVCYVSTKRDISADNGILLSGAAVLGLQLNVETHGDIVQEAWYAFRTAAGTVRYAVLEGFIGQRKAEAITK